MVLARTLIVLVGTLTAACASTQSGPSGIRPEAFPRSRPIANSPEETAVPPVMDATPAAAPAASSSILQTAFGLIGTPYKFGGVSPDTGFDCSGFVSYVLRQHAIEIPRTVAEQFGVGRAVAQDEIQVGDLVFFSTTGPGATHVGFVVSAGTRWEFVHAPADGSKVRIERFDSGYWQQRWIGARRVLTTPGVHSGNRFPES